MGRAQSEGNCDSCGRAGETEKAAPRSALGGHGEESGFDYGRILIKEVKRAVIFIIKIKSTLPVVENPDNWEAIGYRAVTAIV